MYEVFADFEGETSGGKDGGSCSLISMAGSRYESIMNCPKDQTLPRCPGCFVDASGHLRTGRAGGCELAGGTKGQRSGAKILYEDGANEYKHDYSLVRVEQEGRIGGSVARAPNEEPEDRSRHRRSKGDVED